MANEEKKRKCFWEKEWKSNSLSIILTLPCIFKCLVHTAKKEPTDKEPEDVMDSKFRGRAVNSIR